MLIGAHVSPSGGPAMAVGRGADLGANAIQIFNQNPRQWKPREYSDDEVAAFHAAIAEYGLVTSPSTASWKVISPSSGTRKRTAPSSS